MTTDEQRLSVLAQYGIDPSATTKSPMGTTGPDFNTERMGNFGASEFWKLLTATMKIAANDTARQYVFEKAFEKATGKRAQKGFSANATDWGNEWEGSAIAEYSAQTGNVVDNWGDNQKFLKHPKFDVGCFPDGVLRDKNGVIEAKCPFNGGIHLQNLVCGNDVEKFAKMRTKYYIQMQVQIWCSSSDFAHFFSYYPEIEGISRGYLIEIPKNDEVIQKIEEAAELAQRERDSILEGLRLG